MLSAVLLAAAFAYLVWKYVIEDFDHPLDVLPGPPRKPFIGCITEFMTKTPTELFAQMRRFAKVYGDRYVIKFLNRRVLQVHTETDVEIVLTHSKNISKNNIYFFLEPWLGTGLLLSTGAKWHKRRKILTPAFHFNILKYFCEVMDEKSQALTVMLEKKGGQEVDLLPMISDSTLYIICETAMGTQLDSDKSAAVAKYKDSILQIGELSIQRLAKVWLQNDFIFSFLPMGKQFARCLKIVHSFADSVIMERKNNRGVNKVDSGEDNLGRKKRLAMLDLLLEAEASGDIDLEGIREEVNTFMFEGHDTTAMALVYALLLIADHEEVQSNIYAELQSVLGDTDRRPSMADLAEMKYLEAVIKETLRLYPSVPFIAREITEPFKLGDLVVPKGTEVAVHIYDLHRRADLYSDPLKFRPERFLEGEVKHPYAYVPFSAGLRNCIGQRFAMIEMKCMLAEICRNFKLEPREKGWRPQLMTYLVLRPADPIYVKFIKR